MGRTACTEPQYSYTSTPPMGRTACTEPQCLYKGALYLLFLPIFMKHFRNIIPYQDCPIFIFSGPNLPNEPKYI